MWGMSGVCTLQHQAPLTSTVIVIGQTFPRNIPGICPRRMGEGRKKMVERIWSLTMEFIYLMTGENSQHCREIEIASCSVRIHEASELQVLCVAVISAKVEELHYDITGQTFPRNIPGICPRRMGEGRKKMVERIWSLTMEFIYLMTGEECTMVKKTSGDHVTFSSHSNVSEDWSRSQRTAMDPPPQFLIPERNNDKKILEVINKITELLTGEESGAGNSGTSSGIRSVMSGW
ncbi:uncharacterized protein [Aquarana catesbeiana]|uniref:uncharacterized protein n=1 Tax=Aquarana catesbeiana TaxID=8400 RepID=UPI003CC96276